MEVKRHDAPRVTPSIRSALEDLRIDHPVVVYPGTQMFDLAPEVRAVPLRVVVERGSQVILSSRPAGRAR